MCLNLIMLIKVVSFFNFKWISKRSKKSHKTDQRVETLTYINMNVDAATDASFYRPVVHAKLLAWSLL